MALGHVFFARTDIPSGVKNRMLDKILFRQLRFSLLNHQHVTYVSAGFCQSSFSTFTYTYQRLNNHVADQTARLHRLVCAFVVEMQLP